MRFGTYVEAFLYSFSRDVDCARIGFKSLCSSTKGTSWELFLRAYYINDDQLAY